MARNPTRDFVLDNGLEELNKYFQKSLVMGPTKNNFRDEKTSIFDNFWPIYQNFENK